ncbi:MAG: hypothetical protein JWQ64_3411 [Subtercola sp.]|jgi:sugar diacid utilization regulator|nr:hypothetical protein [Subtercola sp.]
MEGAIESLILSRVWGSQSYDENHLDPTELSSKIEFNVGWLLRSLTLDDNAEPPGMAAALAVADEIGTRRAIQGVAIDAVIFSWRTAERVIEEQLIGYAGQVETGELLNAIRRLGFLIETLTNHSIDSYRVVQHEVTSHYDRLSTDLVAQIVSGTGLSAADIEERARVVQADPDQIYAAVAIGIAEKEEASTHLHAQRHLLSHLGMRVRGRILIGTLDDRPLLLIPEVGTGSADSLVALLQGALRSYTDLPGLLLGVSSTSARLRVAHETARQARLALEVGQRTGRLGQIIPYASVIVETLLLREHGTADILLECLRPIANRPELLNTLRVYFDCGLSASAAARELFVHPNTVPHRLRTISTLLGRNLDHIAANADLILALRWLDLT